MTDVPSVGTRVRVEASGIEWRDGWKHATKDWYEGEVVPSFPWLAGDYLCITSNDPKIAVRSIKVSKILRIVDSSGVESKPVVVTHKQSQTHIVRGSKGAVYTVTRTGGNWRCNCPAAGFGRHCRHVDEARKAAS